MGKKRTIKGLEMFKSKNGKLIGKNRINLLWKSWYGPENFIIDFPEEWELSVNCMDDSTEIHNDDIEKSILNPIGHPPLKSSVKKGDKVCILIDDLCLLYTSPSPRDLSTSRMPSSA